jgi:hypothetical protein
MRSSLTIVGLSHATGATTHSFRQVSAAEPKDALQFDALSLTQHLTNAAIRKQQSKTGLEI